MKVTLIAHTPEPERTVAAAAKLCYSPADLDTVMDHLTPEKTRSFLTMLGELGHESPMEHASFTFGIEGVSRSLLAQITRHRIASYSVQSQRYVRENRFDYVLPPQIEAEPEARAEFIAAMEAAQASYERIAAILTEKRRAENLARGMEERAAARAAEKTAIEDARFVLPGACDTKMMVTMNARALHNFFRHRCCARAQWEIRECARQMLALVLPVAPTLFAHCGPPCVTGACPEGKMSCGRAAEVRAEYRAMKEEYCHG